MLQEFDPAAIPTKKVLIHYFCDGLRSSIWAQTDKRGWDLDTWKETIKKAIDIKTKAARQPQSLMKEIDNYYCWGHRPTKTDEPTRELKDMNKNSSRPKKSKTQVSQCSENANISKKAWKEKKKNDQKNRTDCRAQESSTLATGVNTKTFGNGNFRRKNR